MSEWRKINKKLKESKKTLECIFDIMIASFQEKIFFEEFIGNDVIKKSYQDIKDEAFNIAYNLKEKYHQQTIALDMENSSVWVSTFFGILMSGNYPLLINDSKILSSADFAAVINISNISQYLENNNKPTIISWSDKFYFHTSGTTGEYKIVEYSGRKLTNQIINTPELVKKNKILKNYSRVNTIKVYAFLPFSHIFGFIVSLMWFAMFGKTFVINNTKDFREIQKTIIKRKITHFFSVPLVFEAITNGIKKNLSKESEKKQSAFEKLIDFSIKIQSIAPRIGNFITRHFLFKKIRNNILGSNMKVMISGGSYIQNDALRILNGLGYHLFNGYGLTEVGIVSVNLSKKAKKRIASDVGLPFSSYDYYFDDFKQLCIKDVEEDCYYMTNDHFDIREGLEFLYRSDDLIKKNNGEKVSLHAIENKLNIPFSQNKSVIFDSLTDEILLIIKINNELSPLEMNSISTKISDAMKILDKEEYISKVFLTVTKFFETASRKPRRKEILSELRTNPKDFIELHKNIDCLEEVSGNRKLLNEIIEVFSKVLEMPKNEISPQSSFNLDLNGTSLDYYSLIYEMNEKFKIEIAFDENRPLETPADFFKYLVNYH